MHSSSKGLAAHQTDLADQLSKAKWAWLHPSIGLLLFLLAHLVNRAIEPCGFPFSVIGFVFLVGGSARVIEMPAQFGRFGFSPFAVHFILGILLNAPMMLFVLGTILVAIKN